jgi:hypothetical protein
MYTLIAQFPRQQVCRDRQYTGLLRWSAGWLNLALPTEKPPEDFVRQRIIAGRVATNPDVYVGQTINAVASRQDIQTNIREHLNAFNSEAVEAAMDAQLDTALGNIMPTYCAGVVSDQEVENWYAQNGYGSVNPQSPAGAFTQPRM